MRVLFVSPSFYPAFHYGGPTYINRSLCDAMGAIDGVEVDVLTTDADGPGQRVDVVATLANHADNYSITFCSRSMPPDISFGLLARLSRAVRRADIVHLNAVYSFTTIPTLFLCRVMKKPVVWSTMGALQRWQGTTRQRTKAAWEFICNRLCESAQVVMHVTSEEEREESLEKINNASVVILRNGIELPGLNGFNNNGRSGALRLLYLGRLHPIKGVENLLQAMALLKTEVRLSICGEGDPDYENLLRSMVSQLGLTGVVEFCGRVDGDLKEQQFYQSDLCVAPSFKEAFCTVALEALARGVPVIVGRGVPWHRVEEIGCGLWVSNEPKDLAAAIDRAATMPLKEMGTRGRAWMESEFSWPPVAAEMVDIYKQLISRHPLPRPVVAHQSCESNIS
jgi:glycosyltransferase involved in cell wall biosynthesis